MISGIKFTADIIFGDCAYGNIRINNRLLRIVERKCNLEFIVLPGIVTPAERAEGHASQ